MARITPHDIATAAPAVLMLLLYGQAVVAAKRLVFLIEGAGHYKIDPVIGTIENCIYAMQNAIDPEVAPRLAVMVEKVWEELLLELHLIQNVYNREEEKKAAEVVLATLLVLEDGWKNHPDNR